MALRLALAAILLAFAHPARGEEGLFTFDAAPLAQIRADLGVAVDRAWLDRLEAASVRLSSGCSGAIVSARGLTLTNQHCVLACEAALSAPGSDVIAEGFGLSAGATERRCPGLAAEVLEGITDITGEVVAASIGKGGEAFVAARQGAIEGAEQRLCAGAPGFRCQTFAFFGGSVFQVYRYRRFDDVRLVFAPEAQIAFFGGQRDNFAFPRWALDCAFLRLYEAGAPAATPAALAWSDSAPQRREAVFTAGNPGEGERDLTADELVALHDVRLAGALRDETDLQRRLIRYARGSPARTSEVAAPLFAAENEIKRLTGERAALSARAIAGRRAEEAALQAALLDEPSLAQAIGDPWAMIARAEERAAIAWGPWRELEAAAGRGSALYRWARTLVRAAAEREKPSGMRLPGYADDRLPLLARELLAEAPAPPGVEAVELASWLSALDERLGPASPLVQAILAGRTPQATAAAIVAGSRPADPAVRLALWQGGEAAIAASADPMIALARLVDPAARATRVQWEDAVVGPEERAHAAIAEARGALSRPLAYPDASFSLRLSFGRVEARADDPASRPPVTTLGDLFGRAGSDGRAPLTAPWIAARPALDPATALDFVTSNDVTAGSSGSPVVDADERLIGAIFDGNAASLGGAFVYDPARNRAVAVSTAAISVALGVVYHRADLLAELRAPPVAFTSASDSPMAH